jgi:hypothetical protein
VKWLITWMEPLVFASASLAKPQPWHAWIRHRHWHKALASRNNHPSAFVQLVPQDLRNIYANLTTQALAARVYGSGVVASCHSSTVQLSVRSARGNEYLLYAVTLCHHRYDVVFLAETKPHSEQPSPYRSPYEKLVSNAAKDDQLQ